MNDVMPGSDGLGFFVILNKSSELRFGLRRSKLIFRTWVRPVQFVCCGVRVRAFVVSDETVSIVKIVSLSLSSCRKPTLKEGNKSFVPERKKSRHCFVFFGFLCICV